MDRRSVETCEREGRAVRRYTRQYGKQAEPFAWKLRGRSMDGQMVTLGKYHAGQKECAERDMAADTKLGYRKLVIESMAETVEVRCVQT